MKIMVRTRGFSRALGRVLGRALGRHRRRLTTSARRQQTTAVVAKDVDHVDHTADEVHEEPQKPVTDDVREPQDTSLLTDYVYHVTAKVWAREKCTELKLASHGRKETSIFHLPVGEVSITLDDVASLLHLPITGASLTFDALNVDQVVDLLVELLEVSTQEAKDETFQYRGAYVAHSLLTRVSHMSVWYSLTHFVTSTNLEVIHGGVDELVYIYDTLNYASKNTRKHLPGYVTLLQHFPTIASIVTDEDYHERKPHACRWKSGKTLPTIPPHPAAPSLSIKEIDDRRLQFSKYHAPVGQICRALGQCSTYYIEKPPRHPLVVHDDTFIVPDPPQQAVNIYSCQRITESFKHMINMRMVTAGTKAYTLTEHCLRLARGVTEQQNVYVWSRQRRDT
ncbi:hypothetical protein HKD37_10G027884 [Glycine soja]